MLARLIELQKTHVEKEGSLHQLFVSSEAGSNVPKSTGMLPESIRLVQEAIASNMQFDINEIDCQGNTLLHRAAMLGTYLRISPVFISDVPILWDYLLQLGADLSIKNQLGLTALEVYLIGIDHFRIKHKSMYFCHAFNIFKQSSVYSCHIIPGLNLLLANKEDIIQHCDQLEVVDLSCEHCEDILKWLNLHFDGEDLPRLRKNLVNKIEFYRTYAYLEESISQIVLLEQKQSLFRFMYYYNDPSYSLRNLLREVLQRINDEQLPVNQSLTQLLGHLLFEFSQYEDTLTYFKVTQLEALTKQEIKQGRHFYENLDNAFNQPMYQAALKDFMQHVPSAGFFDMQQRYKAFQAEDRVKRQAVLACIRLTK